MQKIFARSLILTLLVWTTCHCSRQVPPFTPFEESVFLDSAKAASAIMPSPDGLMAAQLTVADMGIQLKQCFPANTPRQPVWSNYLKSLAREVRNFSPRERKVLLDNLNQVARWAHTLYPGFLPSDLGLIKVSGRHYGDGAFYTRASQIILPAGAIARPNPARLRRILLHELFHIYSRQHPEVRRQLYEMLGFAFLESSPSLPPSLRRSLLLNPDGLVMNAVMDMDSSRETSYAMPLLRAVPDCYVEGKDDYFGYLSFELYPLKRSAKGWEVQAMADGSSPMDYRDQTVFFRNIGDVTSYIIHPDEILADHFAILMLRRYEPDILHGVEYSPRGEALLEQMHRILAAP